jgi:hypothetical protein
VRGLAFVDARRLSASIKRSLRICSSTSDTAAVISASSLSAIQSLLSTATLCCQSPPSRARRTFERKSELSEYDR